MKTEISQKTPTIRANYYGLLRVCNNLLANAISHSYENSTIEIKAGTCNNAPFPDVNNNDVFVFFSVKDYGCGIASEHLKRIGERFYKAGQNNKSGSGLGLSIVNSILERHKAKIKIESKQDKGSTFTVYFKTSNKQTKKIKKNSNKMSAIKISAAN